MAKKTMTSKVVAALTSGKELTVAKIQKIGLANPYDPVYRMRQRGQAVTTLTRRTRDGKRLSVYTMATPAV